MNSAFRTLGPALERRLQESTSAEDLAPAVGLLTRRVARCISGLAGAVGATAMFGFSVASFTTKPLLSNEGGLLSLLLLASVGIALLAPWIARPLASVRARRLACPPRLTGDPASDMAALELHAKGQRLQRAIQRLEVPSVALPLAAWSLLAPLVIHLVIGAGLITVTGGSFKLADYDGWIIVSAILVGLPHYALVLCGYLFARKMQCLDAEGLRGLGHGEALKALGIATLVSLIPGVFLLGVPSLLVLVTGLAFVPATFRWMRNRVMEERFVLDAVG